MMAGGTSWDGRCMPKVDNGSNMMTSRCLLKAMIPKSRERVWGILSAMEAGGGWKRGGYTRDIDGGECALVEAWVFDHCEIVTQT